MSGSCVTSDDGDAGVAELLEERHDLDARARVEVARSARRRGSARARHQRARDGHALLLAAGELVGVVVERGRRGPPLRAPRGARSALAAGDARVEQRQLHVLQRARARQQVEALEDEAEVRLRISASCVAVQRRDTSRPASR